MSTTRGGFTFPDTLAHELSDNVNGLLRHNGVELHQLVMTESLHDLSLLQKGLGGHGSWLQSLHRYLGGAVPHAWHTEKRVLAHTSEPGRMHLSLCQCDTEKGAYTVHPLYPTNMTTQTPTHTAVDICLI